MRKGLIDACSVSITPATGYVRKVSLFVYGFPSITRENLHKSSHLSHLIS